MRIRVKLVAIIEMIVLLTILAVAFASFQAGNKMIIADVEAQLESVLTLKSSQLRAYFNERKDDINALVNSKDIADLLPSKDTTEPRSNIDARRENLRKTLRLNGYFKEFSIIDEDGEVSLSTNEQHEGMLRTNERYFVEGKQGLYIAPLGYDMSRDVPTATISGPVLDEEGKLRVVLVGDVDLSLLSALMTERVGLRETGETYLVNSYNFVLTSLRKAPGKPPLFMHTQAVKECLSQKPTDILSVLQYTDYAGDNVVGMYKYLPALKMGIIAEMDRKEAYAYGMDLRNTIAGIAGAAAVISLVIAYLLSRTISGPIQILTAGAQKIESGDLGHRIAVHAKGEIGTLASSFNSMTRELRSKIDVEKQRADKTRLVYELGQQVTGMLRLDELLPGIVSAIRDAFDYYNVMLLLPDTEKKYLTVQAIVGGLVDVFPKGFQVNIREGTIGHVAVTGEAQVTGDVSNSPSYIHSTSEETKSELAVPIRKAKQVIGVLVIQSNELHAFDETDMVSMEILTTQIGTAIENAELYEQAQQEIAERLQAGEELKKHLDHLDKLVDDRTSKLTKATKKLRQEVNERVQAEEKLRNSSQKMESLHEVAQQLETSSTAQDVYDITIEAAEKILSFSLASLDIVEEGKLIVKATSTEVPSGASKETRLEQGGLAGETYRSGKTTVFGSMDEVPIATPTKEEFSSGISAPIGDIGVFQVVSTTPDAFTEEDGRLLNLLLGHTYEAIKRINLQRQLKEQAIHDPLTGVYNRRYFTQVIEQEITRSKRYDHPIAFLMVDVDRFKEINDRFGHQMGDRVLQEVAKLLEAQLRDVDIVIRYGGDEFLLVLPETTDGEPDVVKERIAKAMAERNKENRLIDFPVTVSIGAASWRPEGSESMEEVLARADRRMYVEKRKGVEGHSRKEG